MPDIENNPNREFLAIEIPETPNPALLFLDKERVYAILSFKMEINEFQRKLYAEKCVDLANFSLVGLTFASFFAPSFKLVLALSGIVLTIIFLTISHFISKGVEP